MGMGSEIILCARIGWCLNICLLSEMIVQPELKVGTAPASDFRLYLVISTTKAHHRATPLKSPPRTLLLLPMKTSYNSVSRLYSMTLMTLHRPPSAQDSDSRTPKDAAKTHSYTYTPCTCQMSSQYPAQNNSSCSLRSDVKIGRLPAS